jgi:hypothetical protein
MPLCTPLCVKRKVVGVATRFCIEDMHRAADVHLQENLYVAAGIGYI